MSEGSLVHTAATSIHNVHCHKKLLVVGNSINILLIYSCLAVDGMWVCVQWIGHVLGPALELEEGLQVRVIDTLLVHSCIHLL